MGIIISSVNVSLNGVILNYFLWPWLGSKTYIDRDFVYRNPPLMAWSVSKARAKLIHNDDDNNNNILNVHQTLNGELCEEKIVQSFI